MVKRILNWFGGGIFRTLGRIFAYVLIGILIYIIGAKSGINLRDLIGLDVVNAAELKQWTTSQTRLTYDDHGTSSFSDWQSTPYTFSNLSLPVKRVGFRVRSSDGLSAENSYAFTFGYLPTPDSVSLNRIEFTKNADNTLMEEFSCGAQYVNANGYYLSDCSFSPHTNYSSSDYLYITMFFNGNGTYLTSIRPYMFGYDERLGTNAVITNQTNIINNSINNLANDINNSATNIINGINNANKVCNSYDKVSIYTNGYYLTGSGTLSAAANYGITDYLKISDSELTYTLNVSDLSYSCFYNVNKVLISCVLNSSIPVNTIYTPPSGAYYGRFTINIASNKPQFTICKNGNTAITDTLEDDNVDESIDEANDFFSSFTTNTHGLTGIITAPLSAIESLTSATCSPLTIPLPYINKNLNLPCMRTIYVNNFGSFMSIYDAVTLGIISYWILVRIFSLVKDFKNPEHDEIEVVDL